jgi:hypothetical protein
LHESAEGSLSVKMLTGEIAQDSGFVAPSDSLALPALLVKYLNLLSTEGYHQKACWTKQSNRF